MAEEVRISKQFSLDWVDAGKGFIMAVITAVLTAAYDALTTQPVVINWKSMGVVGLIAGIGYLLKNFLEPTKTIIKEVPAPKTEP